MAINNINSGTQSPQLENQRLNQQQAQNQTAAQTASKAAQSTTVPRQDSVSLTQSAQQLSNTQKKSSEAPVNQEKVEKLKQAILSGEYKVNPETLAQSIAKLEGQIFGLK